MHTFLLAVAAFVFLLVSSSSVWIWSSESIISIPTQVSWRLTVTPDVSCAEDPPFVAFGSIVAVDDFERRHVVRKHWEGISTVLGRRVRLFFIVGAPKSELVQKTVEAEAAQHGDIVQHAAPEKYSHLTYKTITLLHWAAQSCPQAKFLVKFDGDVLINLNRVVAYLLTLEHEPNVATGKVYRVASPERDPRKKNYQDPDAYPYWFYPTYMSGSCYMLSRDVVRRLSEIVSSVPRLRNEDCFVGLGLKKLGVVPQNSSPMAPILTEFEGSHIDEVKKWAAVHPVSKDEFGTVWSAMHSSDPA